MTLLAALVSLTVFCLIGLSIPYAVGLTPVVHILAMGEPNLLTMLPQRFYSVADNFSLVAIVLFVLAGELMAFGGTTEYLYKFARVLIGHLRGGLGYSTIAMGSMLGGILGSANASAAILATIMGPAMKEDGYDDVFTNLLIGSVAILGPIIPPSITFVIYGSVVRGVSISELFIAGIGPGLMMAGSFALYVWWIGRKEKWPTHPRAPLSEVFRMFVFTLPAFTVPVVILGGIMGGVMTPTESAGAAVVIALILGFFVYRKLTVQDTIKALQHTAMVSGGVMLLTITGVSLGWTMALDRAPEIISGFINGVTSTKYGFLMIANVLLLIIGTVLDPTAGILVFVPVFLPLVKQFGVDPLHFGLIASVNLTIGMITPPVMETMYVASMITGCKFSKLFNPAWKWTFVAFAVLLLVTYFPSISMIFVKLLLR